VTEDPVQNCLNYIYEWRLPHYLGQRRTSGISKLLALNQGLKNMHTVDIESIKKNISSI
jgi:hypothetical protein